MNRIACQYAIVRFTPFIETGEFANVGVVMMAAGERYFGFELETRRYGRVTRFFEELDARLYRATLSDLRDELERIYGVLKENGFDRRMKDNDLNLAQELFAELTRPRESIIRFSEPGVVLTNDPAKKLKELFGYYIERNFVTRQQQEALLESRMRRWLNQVRIGERFARERIGDDGYYTTFPFVELRNREPTKVIKPLHLGQESPSRILDHSGTWAFRLDQLRRRNHLPDRVLLAVDGPQESEADGKREAAFREAVDMLEDKQVTVFPYEDRVRIEQFALSD